MRSVTGLHARLCDPATLDAALTAAVAGKRRRPDVAWLLFRRDQVVGELSRSLTEGSWAPQGFELLRVRDPKPRVIARAPIADRVVHRAIVDCLGASLTRGLRDESYACLPHKGTHRAVLRLHEAVRTWRYFLHLDVRAYFASVDLEILRGLLARRVRDPAFLAVIDRVLCGGAEVWTDPELRAFAGLSVDWPPPGRGLPIGAHTSQVFAAHVYLEALDHFVKRVLRVPGYLRYCDDLFLFGDSRAELRRWRAEVGRWLMEQRGLRLKHPEAAVRACHGHLDGLGHRISRQGIAPSARALHRMAARVAAEIERPAGRGPRVDLARSLASSVGVGLFGAIAKGRV